jgi:hypothetical protein
MVFDINNGNAQQIAKIAVNHLAIKLKIYGDIIILTDTLHSTAINRAYRFTNNDLDYLGQFTGGLDHFSGFESERYFLNYINGTVEYRETENPLNVIYTSGSLPFSDTYSSFQHINDNTIVLWYNSVSHVYTYNDSFEFNLTYSTDDIFDVYNGYSKTIDRSDNYNMTFSAIENGFPRTIGGLNTGQLLPQTYLFPEHRKMILDSRPGIHLYDIEYTVSDKDAVTVPIMTSLLSNYPNPFNPATTITFIVGNAFMRSVGTDKSVPYSVSIDIYNTKGQKVRSLVNGNFSQGEHKVVWNGTDDRGVSVGSGVYFYRMKTDSYTETKKMLLIK